MAYTYFKINTKSNVINFTTRHKYNLIITNENNRMVHVTSQAGHSLSTENRSINSKENTSLTTQHYNKSLFIYVTNNIKHVVTV